MSGVIVEAKTVEEAVAQACRQLQVSQERVRFVILEAPKKGFLGIFGSRKAKVEVEPITVRDDVEAFLQETITKMGIEVTFVVGEGKKGELIAEFKGKDVALLIGKNGYTLESLQYLVNRVFSSQLKKKRVWLEANGYRKRKEQFVAGLAERTGELVMRTKRRVALDPMPSNERKIVHSTLERMANLRTESAGSDPDRYVVIHWKE